MATTSLLSRSISNCSAAVVCSAGVGADCEPDPDVLGCDGGGGGGGLFGPVGVPVGPVGVPVDPVGVLGGLAGGF